MDSSQSCNGPGSDGWSWRPWNEGSASPMWRNEVGPDGRCCPNPLKKTLEPMLIITLWGGENDMWMGLSNYRPTTQAASNYFSSIPTQVHVACSGTHGHVWPRMMLGREFNNSAADLLYHHPKGSDPKTFMLKDAPAGL